MTATTTGKRATVMIRTNYGSHRVIDRIYWHDQGRGTLSVRFADGSVDTVEANELEALEADGDTYADLSAALFRQCKRDDADVIG